MKKKETEFDTGRSEKMSDVQLSKKLGSYQKQARTWLCVGLVGVLGGLIAYFAVQDTALKVILVTVLFGGGICCAIFVSGDAQKKLKALMQEQMGDFFASELRKAFGPDLHTEKMRIDQPLLESMDLLTGQWEECEIENFHEGSHRGTHFSAANVRLDHVYQRGMPNEGFETCTEMVFKGIVLRYETRIQAPSAINVHARSDISPRGILTDNEAFNRRFCIAAEPEADAFYLLTPQFMEFLTQFEERIEGKLSGFRWERDVFTLALETDYGFAAVASHVDLSDLDAVRSSYIRSLQAMGETLDVLLENIALFKG